MAALPAEQEPLREIEALLDGWNPDGEHKPKKRSLAIAGHCTSISLEEPFWDGLRAIASEKGVSVAALVAAIDAVRGKASLSSAIRLFLYRRAGEARLKETSVETGKNNELRR